MTTAAFDAGLLEALRAAVPDGLLTAAEDLIAYGFDGTFYEHTPPVVVLPTTTAEVCAVHRIALERRIALTPRAMGSGLSGGSVPLGGSIVLGVARMDRILDIDPVDGVAVVQPGVITAHLQAEVERQGLFYPPDPSSLKQSAIGGNVAENAGGARALKYGVTGDYVLALEVVLPTTRRGPSPPSWRAASCRPRSNCSTRSRCGVSRRTNHLACRSTPTRS